MKQALVFLVLLLILNVWMLQLNVSELRREQHTGPVHERCAGCHNADSMAAHP